MTEVLVVKFQGPDGENYYLRQREGNPEASIYDSEGNRVGYGKDFSIYDTLGQIFEFVDEEEIPGLGE